MRKNNDLKRKIRRKFINIVTDALEESKIYELVQENRNMLKEMNERQCMLQERVDENLALTRFGVERQYYLNSFFSPEFMKLEKHSQGDLLLCGNYGDPNTGDEWMLKTMLDYLELYCDKHVTVMLVPNRFYDTSDYKNVSVIHFPQSIYDFDLLADKFDEVVFGGGAIIEDEYYQEGYDFGVSICRILVDLSLRFIKQKKRVFCVGLSTSKNLYNKEYIKKLTYVIEGAYYFSVRDTNSLVTLERAGIPCNNIGVINDIVFSNFLLESKIDMQIEQKKEAGGNIKRIGIVYIVNEFTIEGLYCLIRKMREVCSESKEKGIITLIPFYDSRHNDLQYYERIRETEKTNDFEVVVTPYTSDLQEIAAILGNQDIVFNMRYHSMLLSLCLGINTVNILYHEHPHYYNKVDYLMKQFGYSAENCILETDLRDNLANWNDNVLCCNDVEKIARLCKESKKV